LHHGDRSIGAGSGKGEGCAGGGFAGGVGWCGEGKGGEGKGGEGGWKRGYNGRGENDFFSSGGELLDFLLDCWMEWHLRDLRSSRVLRLGGKMAYYCFMRAASSAEKVRSFSELALRLPLFIAP